MKVTKRSCDVTPRSKYQKSKGHPWSPCASNLVQFRLLFTKLRHFEKNGTRNFSLIGRHLESVSRTIPVFKHTLAPEEGFSASAATYISNIYAVAGPGRTSFGHGGNREGYSELFRRQCVAKGSKVSIFH